MPGFREVVQQAWTAPSTHTQPVHIINHKLKSTALGLKSWSKGLFSDCKLQLLMALDVILQLDIAQESRALSLDERHLRAGLKRRVKGLAALERSRKRQDPESDTSVRAMLTLSSSTSVSMQGSAKITS
jgi:hypothetical protein